MQNLTRSLIANPAQVRVALANYFYKSAKTNIALYNFEHTPTYRTFKADVKNTIVRQVTTYSEPRLVSEIGFFSTPTKQIVSKYFKPFITVFPGGKQAINKFYLRAATAGGQAALDKIEALKPTKAVEAGFNIDNPALVDYFSSASSLMIDSVDQTTKNYIAETIQTGIDEGLTNDEIAQLISEGASDIGAYRSELIAFNEMARAMSYTERLTYIDNNVEKMEWITSQDARVDYICAANEDEGPISVNDTFGSGDSEPPAHVNAILGNQEVKALDVAAKMVAPYDGLAVYFTTERGVRLAVTPKHPVATGQGWVEASKLKLGDNLLYAPRWIEGVASIVQPESQPIVAKIEDVVVPGNVVFTRVPATSIDLDGDGVSCKYIDVIYAKSKLRVNSNGSFTQIVAKDYLGLRDIFKGLLTRFGPLNKFSLTGLTTSGNCVGSSGIPFILASGSFTHHQAVSKQRIAEDDTSLLEAFGDRQTATTSVFSKLIDRYSSFITFDKVVNIEIKPFHGFVYDMTTKYHYYTTNGLVVSNCRCYINPVFSSDYLTSGL